MKPIGRDLAFYLKYLDEMEALYEDENISEDINKELSKVGNKKEILDMINKVGDRANEQVHNLLKETIEKVKTALPKDISYKDIRTEDNWEISLWLWPKKMINPKKWQIGIGFHNEYNGESCFMAWVWAKGGQNSERKLTDVLGNKIVVAGSKDLGWKSSGSIAIGILRLPVQNMNDFEIDSEPFMAEVDRIFKEIAPDLPEIFSI